MMTRTFLNALRSWIFFTVAFMVIVVLQLVFFTDGVVHFYGDVSERVLRFGLGAPLVATTDGTGTSYQLNWTVLILNLFFICCLACLLAHAWSRYPELRRRAKAFWVSAPVIVVLSLFASIAFSKHYWGYYFSRPPVLSEIYEVAAIRTITPLQADWNNENIGTLRT